jgi:hypothetical protein
LLLWSLLAIEILGSVLAMLCPDIVHDDKAVGAVKDILSIVLGPTVALVGAATGFYYGTKS